MKPGEEHRVTQAPDSRTLYQSAPMTSQVAFHTSINRSLGQLGMALAHLSPQSDLTVSVVTPALYLAINEYT